MVITSLQFGTYNMQYYVIIPAHNEAEFIRRTLDSLLDQNLQPKKVIVVNDNSNDTTSNIIEEYVLKDTLFKKVDLNSSTEHLPGSKVINAFNHGLALLDDAYDFIVKLDADLILPKNYFEQIALSLGSDSEIGIAGGYIYELNETGLWLLNHPMDKNHVRGAFKAYSKACFKAIGGLKCAMGWDTVDELLAHYNGFRTHTDDTLKVKHLRPTRTGYNSKAKLLQGKAMYRMRYGVSITLIASLKMALKHKNWRYFLNNMEGYFEAKKHNAEFLVSETEGSYIRKLRWTNIKRKFIS